MSFYFTMRNRRIRSITLAIALVSTIASSSEVRVIGEMRRMFMAHDIGPNVALHDVLKLPGF